MQEPIAQIEEKTSVQPEPEDSFKPQGSLVFFGLLIIIIAVIWFSVYLTMISRS